MKKILALVLAGCLVVALMACGNKPAETTPADTKKEEAPTTTELVTDAKQEEMTSLSEEKVESYIMDSVTMASAPQSTLAPWGTKGGGTHCYMCYEMLYEMDAEANPYPILADATYEGTMMPGCDHEAGSGDYFIHIYDYIKDQKGNDVKASDVAYCFNYQFENAECSGWNDFLGAEAVDETTVKLSFSQEQNKLGQFNNVICRQFITSEKALSESANGFADDICGTGPYKFGSYTSGAELVLDKWDEYWQTNEDLRPQTQQANVKQIKIVFQSEASQLYLGLTTGALDIVRDLSADYVPEFMDGGQYADQFATYAYSQKFVNYLNPNCDEASIMSDLNMRLAVFNAINLEGLCLALGNKTPAAAYTSDYYSDYTMVDWAGVEGYNSKPDASKVKGYLEAAGYNGEPVVLLSGDSNQNDIMVAMLQQNGINATSLVQDRATVNTTLNDPTAWDLTIGMMAGDFIAQVWEHGFAQGNTPEGDRTSNFVRDDEWEALLQKALTPEGHTPETMLAWWQRAVDNGYTMGLFTAASYDIIPENTIYVCIGDKAMLLPGACIYADPAK